MVYYSAAVSSSATVSSSYVYAVAASTGAGVTAGQVLWQSPLLTSCTANNAPTVVNGVVLASCAYPSAKMQLFRLPSP